LKPLCIYSVDIPIMHVKAGKNKVKQAVFEIKRNAVGRYYFIFRDANEAALVVSGSFYDRAQLEKCLAQVREAALVADIAVEGVGENPPLFRIDEGPGGLFFSLFGFAGEVLFSSKAYADWCDCIMAIELLKKLAFDAGIVDSL